MSEVPNAETATALKEFDEMRSNPEKYPRYSSFQDAMKDTLDPFYSEQNQARLRKSIAEMEATGGTIHNVPSVTDSLTGILSNDNIDSTRSKALSEKYSIDD